MRGGVVIPAVILCGVVLWCLVRGIWEAWKQHKAHLKVIEDRYKRAMFIVAKGELETLEKIIERDPRGFRTRRENESPWDYTRALADWGGMGLKPWQPTFGNLTISKQVAHSVSVSVRLEVYTTTVEGVVHRVGMLPIQSAGFAHVLLCEPTKVVEEPVEAHEINNSPVITCLACVVKTVN